MLFRRVGAALFGLFIGCGDIVPGGPDAPTVPGDGSDAPVDGAPGAGPVVIEVKTRLGDGNPELGANVLVMTDEGTVVFDGLVDGVGKVSAQLPRTGWVTVRLVNEPAPGERVVQMTTVRGVEPGEHLTFGAPLAAGLRTGATTTRSFSYTPFSSTASHTVFTPCGNRFLAANATPSGTLAIFEGCAPERFDVLAVATQGASLNFVYMPDQDRAATTAITVPTPWTAMNDLTATYANVPPGMEYFATVRYTLLDGVPATNTGGNISDVTAGGSFIQHLPYPQGVGSARFDISFGNQTSGERQQVTIRTATPTSTIGFDFATQNLPRLLTIPTETVDGASWTETSLTHQSDARISIWRGAFTGAIATTVDWTVVDGERGSSLVLPTLPPSYAAYDPRTLTGFSQLGDRYVYYVDCDGVWF